MRAATRRRIAVPTAITAGLLCSGLLVWHSSYAAFTADTSTATNSLGSGSVTLTNDHTSSAVFSASANLAPGANDTQCVAVTYSGTLPSEIRMYASGNVTSNLAQYLTFTVDILDPGVTNCTGGAGLNLYTGPLSNLPTQAHDFPTGLKPDTWKPSGSDVRVYRFGYALADNNAAQNKTADVTLSWQAKSLAGSQT